MNTPNRSITQIRLRGFIKSQLSQDLANYVNETIDDLINSAYQEGYDKCKQEYDFTKGR